MEQPFTAAEVRDIQRARALLENPPFTIKLSNLLGTPIDKGFALLPKNWSEKINQAAKAALFKALDVAIATTKKPPKTSFNRLHKILVGASGGVGGAFGLAALPIELPISTTIMLRSIVEIASTEGHDPRSLETKLACLEVFALSGSRPADGGMESAYWLTRMALSQAVAEATSHLAQRGMVDTTAPALVRLISAIGSRFGVVISEEVAAKALPIIGAVGGSMINVIFMDHFQQIARGHFILLRLEKIYGTKRIEAQYKALSL